MHTNIRDYSSNFHRLSPEILLNSAQFVAYIYLTGQRAALRHPLLKLKSGFRKIFQPIMSESKKCFFNPKVGKNSITQHYHLITMFLYMMGGG